MEAQAGGRNLEIVLLHELSSGTFARLYLAEARAPGGIERIVAVKILREQWNESAEVINRTRDEARLLARLRHKNILRVEDLSAIDGQLAIIMEFVDGLDLKQLVEELAKRGQKVPTRAAIQIVAEAASALEAAYFKVPYGLDAPLHVVHRDIKPSNVMVSVEGELKVLDFGTARSSQAFRSVQTGALRFGSLKYMSPERREGDRGEHSADVYALGLMLLEILKGEWLPLLPMDTEEHDETIAEEVSRLGALGMPNREWDIALRQVLLQMLSGDPSLRPSAEQVSKLLRAFAEQAEGDTLEAFAEVAVAPIAKHLRGNLSGGALAGTRFIVNASSPDPMSAVRPAPPVAAAPSPHVPATPVLASRTWDNPADAPSRPAMASPTAAPSRAARPAPRGFDEDEESPTYAGVPAGAHQSGPWARAAPAAPAPAPIGPGSMGPSSRGPGSMGPSSTGPAPVAPAAYASAAHAPAVEYSHARQQRDYAPAEEAPAGGNSMAIFAGGAFVLFAFACAGLFGAGGVYWYLRAPDAAGTPSATPMVAAAPAPASAVTTGDAAPAVAVGSAPLSVTMEGAPIQWIRVHTVLGKRVLSGNDTLTGAVDADTYELSLKQVGRPALKGTVAVPAGGLSLVCKPGSKPSTVTCAGVEPPVVLEP